MGFENVTALTRLLQDGLAEIVRQLQSIRNDGGMADTAGRVRVNVESGTLPTVTTVGTVTTCTTCTTCSAVTNVVSAGGYMLQAATVEQSNMGAKFNRKYITT